MLIARCRRRTVLRISLLTGAVSSKCYTSLGCARANVAVYARVAHTLRLSFVCLPDTAH